VYVISLKRQAKHQIINIHREGNKIIWDRKENDNNSCSYIIYLYNISTKNL